MTRILILGILYLLINGSIIGQEPCEKGAKEVLFVLRSKHRIKDSFLLFDRLNFAEMYQNQKVIFVKPTWADFFKNDTFGIRRSIENLQGYKWKVSMDDKGKLLKSSYLDSVFAIKKYFGWTTFRALGGEGFYSFAPVFFRKMNYCLAIFQYKCGSECGWAEIVFLEKANDKWVVKNVISEEEY